MNKQFYVYILTSKNRRVLYTGVTNDLLRRISQHREPNGSDFTHKYHIDLLVYYEVYDDARTAIEREKQVKAGSRKKKLALINAMNPGWIDLAQEL